MRRLLLGFMVLLWGLAHAKELPQKPSPPTLVNDFAGVLSSDEVRSLEDKLRTYYDTTSTQIAIVIEKSLEGEDAFDYSVRLAEAWGIGEKGKNNGVLIYVATDDRKVRIQNGYGMEGTITDALSKRIIEEQIKPNFRSGNYYQGLDEATTVVIQAAAGEYVNDRPARSADKPPVWVIILVIIVVIIIFGKRGGGRGRGPFYGSGPFFGTFGGGGFSGGGFGGGSSGGGFGGFGGGSFGGGGAGGSW